MTSITLSPLSNVASARDGARPRSPSAKVVCYLIHGTIQILSKDHLDRLSKRPSTRIHPHPRRAPRVPPRVHANFMTPRAILKFP
jgi:hypothetical protein